MTALRAPLRPGSADLALAGVLALAALLSLGGPPSWRTAVAGVAALAQVAVLLFVRTSPTVALLVFALTVPFALDGTGSVVAHHASAVAVQASAARSNPAALPDAVTHIEEGGLRIAEAVRALGDLAPPTRPPAPLSRAGVEELLAPARAAGLPVTAEVEGEPAAEPGEADLFAHRIVVEALTNVLRHAGPSATRLRVQHRPQEVVVEVRDSGVLPGHRTVTRGSGLGLVGVRERAALLGGAAEAGPDAQAGWVVRARLPRPGGSS